MPDAGATQVGAGYEPPPVEIWHDLRFYGTADDRLDVWVDGDVLPLVNNEGWSALDDVLFTLPTGPHVIAVHAQDIARAISGFIALVEVDGAPLAATGAGWVVADTDPGVGWEALGYDDSAWVAPTACTPSEVAVWGTYWTADLIAAGAEWIWVRPCLSLGEGWFRLDFELP